jgi:hypothetical protein
MVQPLLRARGRSMPESLRACLIWLKGHSSNIRCLAPFLSH